MRKETHELLFRSKLSLQRFYKKLTINAMWYYLMYTDTAKEHGHDRGHGHNQVTARSRSRSSHSTVNSKLSLY